MAVKFTKKPGLQMSINFILLVCCLGLLLLMAKQWWNISSNSQQFEWSNQVESSRPQALYWRWFGNDASPNATRVEEVSEVFAAARINAELMGVIITPDYAAATIKLSGKPEAVYHIGDELERGVEIKAIAPYKVVVEERGRLAEIVMIKYEPITQNVQAETSADNQQGFSLPDIFSMNLIQTGDSGTALEVSNLSEAIKNLAELQDGDVIVQVDGRSIQEVMANPDVWLGYGANSELPVTIIRNNEEITLTINAFNLSAEILPNLNTDLIP
ncbi:hypothetical protein OAP18_00255 [Gammaproteobacteria bacterium]|nr:hypothetical protein [Gammaproteobacteria bacterium]